MSVNSVVEHVLYINLNERTDRRKEILAELTKLNLLSKADRFNAIKTPNGRIGCSLSHLKCLQLAKERQYRNVLIVEDDALFINIPLLQTQFATAWQDIMAQGQEQRQEQEPSSSHWDVIIFAGNNIPPYVKKSNAHIQVSRCQTSACYLVNATYYDTLIENLKDGVAQLMKFPEKHSLYALDRYWFSIQQRDRWYLITPMTVIQRPGYSDIEKCKTNYTNLMLDLDKKYLFK